MNSLKNILRQLWALGHVKFFKVMMFTEFVFVLMGHCVFETNERHFGLTLYLLDIYFWYYLLVVHFIIKPFYPQHKTLYLFHILKPSFFQGILKRTVVRNVPSKASFKKCWQHLLYIASVAWWVQHVSTVYINCLVSSVTHSRKVCKTII